jgi:hypothetical protein
MLKERVPGARLWNSGRLFDLLGDYEFNDESHHGTPEERVEALEAGFNDYRNGNVGGIAQASEVGKAYVLNRFPIQ